MPARVRVQELRPRYRAFEKRLGEDHLKSEKGLHPPEGDESSPPGPSRPAAGPSRAREFAWPSLFRSCPLLFEGVYREAICRARTFPYRTVSYAADVFLPRALALFHGERLSRQWPVGR